MPSESELRNLLGAGAAANRLDPVRIVAESRRRRLPRQLGAGVIGALAIAGFAVVAVPSLQPPPPAAVSTLGTPEAGLPAEGGAVGDTSASIIKRAPAERLNLCGAPLTEVEPSTLGLRLDVAFAESAAIGSAPVSGIVRLTNSSTVTISGSTAAAPAITVSENGLTLWHSPSPGDLTAVRVNLAPGESLDFAATFEPVLCAAEDDAAEQFRPGLPPLAAGNYELSAALDFVPDAPPEENSTVGLELVTGPTSPIELQ